MLTKEEALTSQRFHQHTPQRNDGSCYVFERNGEPEIYRDGRGDEEFRVPLRYPGNPITAETIWSGNCVRFHSEQNCPFRKASNP
jgi:hypothetical protein